LGSIRLGRLEGTFVLGAGQFAFEFIL